VSATRAQACPDRRRRRAALMGVRPVGMAQPVRRDLLLQPGRFGGRGKDLANALVRDRDDPVVGLFALGAALDHRMLRKSHRETIAGPDHPPFPSAEFRR
jgi:hypothetical protein